jgi:hypothetical protein
MDLLASRYLFVGGIGYNCGITKKKGGHHDYTKHTMQGA